MDQLPAALSRSIFLRLAPDSGYIQVPGYLLWPRARRGRGPPRPRYSRSPARCRPEPGPPPRSPTGSVFPRREHVRATRSACAHQPGGHEDATACRRRPHDVDLGPVVQYLCWWQRLLSPINTCTPRRFYTSRKPCADTRVRPCKSAGRGLCRGVRDLFLRALVVENDAGENVHRQGVMDLVEKW